MASIVKRKKNYSVVYYQTTAEGERKQRWESYPTKSEALKRKQQIEQQEKFGKMVLLPDAKTVRELLTEFVSTYGYNKWALSTYKAREAMINNYINPYIGDVKLVDITPMMIDQFYLGLLKERPVVVNNRKPAMEFISPSIVREVHKILNCAFQQAVKWRLMEVNPAKDATLPKVDKKTRNIWTPEELKKAFEVCEDDILLLAMHLAFSCTLRIGELLGLTWDCVDVSDDSREKQVASIFVEKELQRVGRDALEQLGEKDIIFKFPPAVSSPNTVLVLKKPKTKTSERRVYLPDSVAELLIKRKQDIEEMKELFGSDFQDYNLVFSSVQGRPIEHQIIDRAMKKLIRENDLPDVVFHSLRHLSVTYKLKMSGGDMKAVQGDSGHAQMKMVADVYSHILDEDRKLNAQRMQADFYAENINITSNKAADTPTASDEDELLQKLLSNPEALAKLKAILNEN